MQRRFSLELLTEGRGVVLISVSSSSYNFLLYNVTTDDGWYLHRRNPLGPSSIERHKLRLELLTEGRRRILILILLFIIAHL